MAQVKSVVMAVVLGLGLAGGWALAGEDKHHHHGDGGVLPSPTLNKGKKWKTDDVARAGMQRVRDQVQAAVPGVHDGSFTHEKYVALAASLEQELQSTMAKCKLTPEVDAQLHLVLAQLFEGIATMREEGQGMTGVVKVMRGLKSYSEAFEHPGWKPVKH